jgi:EpsI family protein
MTSRRDVLIGGACLAGAGAAYALIPRRRVSLLGATTVASIVPMQLPDWTSRDVTDLVAPKEEDSLAARIYGETVGRVYRQTSTGAQVMMLLAHGNTQSDDLQLHRPEVCYPAFGYTIHQNQEVAIPLVQGASIPGRDLVAMAPDRRETILYWSRLGEYFPTNRSEQHLDRTRTAMKGVIADGILSRFSMEAVEPSDATAIMRPFVAGLIKAVAPAHRPALIGTVLSQKMASMGV